MTDTTSAAPSDEEILQAYDSVPAHGNPLDVHLAGLRAVFALWFKHMEPLTDEQKRARNPYIHSRSAAIIWLNGFEAAERHCGVKKGDSHGLKT